MLSDWQETNGCVADVVSRETEPAVTDGARRPESAQIRRSPEQPVCEWSKIDLTPFSQQSDVFAAVLAEPPFQPSTPTVAIMGAAIKHLVPGLSVRVPGR